MRIPALIICILLSFSALGQATRADLEKRRQSIMEAIRITEQQLEATKKDKNATMGQLRALKSKLAERQRLIRNINEEIGQINNHILSSSNEVTRLQQNLEILKMRYAQSVRYAYKTRSSYDMLAFLFSSNDFNEAIRRLKYLKKYRDYRKRQAEDIRLTQNRIENKIKDLNHQKSEKDVLLSAEEQQKLVLQKESNETNQVVLQLKGKENQLVREIASNRKAAKQLDRAVAEIIRREMEIARKKAEEEQRKRAEEEARRAAAAAAANNSGVSVATGSNLRTTPGTAGRPAASTTGAAKLPGTGNSEPIASAKPKPAPVSYNLSMTPEAAALSSSFENNRGRLPWPVEKGFISDAFGTHRHPVAEKVMIENNGIDITTSTGATARAVFDGTVSKVFYIPGMEWNVLVNHGRYFTLYSKLANVTVKNNQEIRTKQVIGTVSNNEEGQAVMNFQVWKDGNKMDPEGWIAR